MQIEEELRNERRKSPANSVQILQARLKQQEDRCRQLQVALDNQQQHSIKILKGIFKFS